MNQMVIKFYLLFLFLLLISLSMGSSNQKPTNQAFVSLHNHHLESAKVISWQGQQYLKVVFGAEQLEYKRWRSCLEVYTEKQQKSSLILFLPEKWKFIQKGICSTMGSLEVLYPKYIYLLIDQITNRSKRTNHFRQTELWLVFYKLIIAAKQARQHQDWLGDIRPRNIFMTRQRNIHELKVSCMSSWPYSQASFHCVKQKQPSFAAPEDAQSFQKGMIIPVNRIAGEMFSIGLTLLCMACLVDCEVIYNQKANHFDNNIFQDYSVLLKASSHYSEILRSLILNLILLQPQQRLTNAELQLFLSKHADKINKQQPFIIDNAPEKLHKSVHSLKIYLSDKPKLLANPSILSQDGGSGLAFPEYLQVQRVKPEYGFLNKQSFIDNLK